MVFMGAGHVDGVTAPLSKHANDDLLEMSRVGSDGPNGRLNIFVQRHGDMSPPTRYWIGWPKPQQANAVPPPLQPMPVPAKERDAKDGRALKRFMSWALKSADHKKGDCSLLVLWGHAYHFAIGAIETQTGIEALDFGELKRVLTEFQMELATEFKEQWAVSKNDPEVQDLPTLDVLGFDACDLAGVEIAHLLSPFAGYLVASQIGIPLPGWPYEQILTRLKSAAATEPMSPAQFGSFAVRKYCEHYNELDEDGDPIPVSLTLLDLEKASEVFKATERLAEQLALAGGADTDELEMIQDQFRRSQTFEGKPFIDVADFCLSISRYTSVSAVRAAAAALGDLLIRPASNGDPKGSRGSFIVEHSRNSHSTARLQGVSLYAPQIVADDWRGPRFYYSKFASSKESFWSRLIHVLAEGT
jgi:hypothetical protein